MPKRRRLLTPMKKKTVIEKDDDTKDVSTARGRLKGALLDMLEPMGDDSDGSYEHTPVKRERNISQDRSYSSDDDDRSRRDRSPQRQSYVLKLFDRSVDLSQFSEDSPLYPICRAWIANQPKADYKTFGKHMEPMPAEDSVDLPGPEGDPVSRIPPLLPEQKERSKDNINLNYREASLPSREELIEWNSARWGAVRGAWLRQAARVEARYSATQTVLNALNVNAL